MNLNHKTNFQNGDPLDAEMWNKLAEDVNELGAKEAGGANNESSFLYMNEKGNLCLETTAENTPSGKKGKINIEANDDIQIKPGDDLSLHAHHRAEGNRNEVSLKILTDDSNKDEIPAALKINSGDITITNKDCVNAFLLEIKDTYKKTPDYEFSNNPFTDLVSGTVYIWDQDNLQIFSAINAGHEVNGAITLDMGQDLLSTGVGKTRVFKTTNDGIVKYYKFTRVSKDDGVTNVNFEDASGFGYLKVRAQAIDLRCEEHGGIALQPKGQDGQGNMNKIKFEHGGGDGLEFGTFNTEHTSIFTGDYRFNKDGVIRLAERFTEKSNKADANDSTTAYKYKKNNAKNNTAISEQENKTYNSADDFYDFIDSTAPTCTWEDIVKFIAWAKANKTGKDWASIWAD